MPRLTRVPTEPTQLLGARNGLRVTKRDSQNVFGDEASDLSDSASDFQPSRSATWSLAANDGGSGVDRIAKKPPPPPPPPSRSTKPPPPLPMKRSALSTSEVPHR
jgi:hypothetical protein